MGRKRGLGVVFAAALGIPAVGAARADEAPRAPAATQPGTTAAASDDAISAEINDALSSRTEMRNGSISVATHDGVVTLSGTVASPDQRQAAVDTARQTRGVVRVEDHLRLLGSTPADPEVPVR